LELHQEQSPRPRIAGSGRTDLTGILSRIQAPTLVITSDRGADPATIETQITKPIEDAAASLANIDTITSTSDEGVSTVAVQFTTAANENLVAVDVERVVNAIRSQLPPEADAPTIVKPEVSLIPVITIGISGPQPLGEINRVAKDRIISTVDPDARHGHKTQAHAFDGYKGHVALDPDSELITGTAVTAGNRGDGTVVAALLADDLPAVDEDLPEAALAQPAAAEPLTQDEPSVDEPQLTVYGDAAYGAGPVLAQLEQADVVNRCKVQPPRAPAGHFTKDAFMIDLAAGRVTCPAGHTVALRPDGAGRVAHFAPACSTCPLAIRCTTARGGRSVHVGPYESQLATARHEQTDPAWQADYRATRPKVERKLAHLLRRLHGGRRARVRGQPKVAADFALLAAAVNLARLAVLGLTGLATGWALRPA